MRVLLYCPTYRLERETVDSIMRLDYGQHKVDVLFRRWNPCDNPFYNRLYNYRQARDIVLEQSYEALFIVESDMIVPEDALLKLSEHDADIVLGLYVHRHGDMPFNFQPFLNAQLMSLDHYSPGCINWSGANKVMGGGFGCTLILRHVLERINFRLFIPAGVVLADADTWFFHDAMKEKYNIIGDGRVVCGHITPDGRILWPTPDGVIIKNTTTRSPYHLGEQNGTT